MKKMIVCLLVFLAAASVHADPIDLGNFPIGQWLDAKYDAVWDFSSHNIRILSPDGKILYDFSEKTVLDFKVIFDGIQPGISFTCPEAGKSYRFIKPLTNLDLVMEIDRRGMPTYIVSMKKQ
jgi:hypothetical protein